MNLKILKNMNFTQRIFNNEEHRRIKDHYYVTRKDVPIKIFKMVLKFDYNRIENLIVFGDSHSVVGTNYTDMTYTGRNHSGDFNNMKLWNYATPRAPIYEKLFNDSRDLKTQCDYFYENMTKGKKFCNTWNENNSLFAFWFGTIDIGFRNHNYKTIEELSENFFNLIKRMYDYGLRNILILSAPPLYIIPSHRNFSKCRGISDENCIKFLKNEVLTFNDEIIAKSNIFFNKHTDINLIYYSTVDIFENIISNCNEYKFKDCINTWGRDKKKNVNDYFWANSHISDLANKILAENINNLLMHFKFRNSSSYSTKLISLCLLLKIEALALLVRLTAFSVMLLLVSLSLYFRNSNTCRVLARDIIGVKRAAEWPCITIRY
ncbi:hypothetical protein H8356DRAFT_1395032 [Neocallimastix lanati (nom. inval.)]|nr:hypothetical protein H8356DRAFT_1395032 [Neocallimastix sp. JGI-2020a]